MQAAILPIKEGHNDPICRNKDPICRNFDIKPLNNLQTKSELKYKSEFQRRLKFSQNFHKYVCKI